MDLRKLEAFYYVYITGSFSKAGTEMFLSQPTVSAHVSALEKELGVLLFDRSGKVALPTPAGKLLFDRVREIFELVQKTKQEISLLKGKVEGEVVIGASTIPGNYLLPRTISGFLKLYKNVKIFLEIGDSLSIWNKVLTGKVDFGLTGALYEDSLLETVKLLEDDLIIIASKNYWFKLDSNTWNIGDLLDLPWVVREKGSGTRKSFEKALNSLGIFTSELNVVLEAQNTESLLQCVFQGVGLGFCSRLAAQKYLEKKELIEVKLKNIHISRCFYLVWHKRRTFLPLAQRLREVIIKDIKEMRDV
ncbi:MAG: selenium metabolism-associated LysR family transcriptional regulator [Desulfonauticus sp.]|nr:selenium metabolism-associated LysR family transcriptional regulator [Desulfonauticus sp.]